MVAITSPITSYICYYLTKNVIYQGQAIHDFAGILNFPVGRVWDGPRIKEFTRDALGQKAISSRVDGAGDSAIVSRNPWR